MPPTSTGPNTPGTKSSSLLTTYAAASTAAAIESVRTVETTGAQTGFSASRAAAARPANESSARIPAPANWCTQPAKVMIRGAWSAGKTAASTRHSTHTVNSNGGPAGHPHPGARHPDQHGERPDGERHRGGEEQLLAALDERVVAERHRDRVDLMEVGDARGRS